MQSGIDCLVFRGNVWSPVISAVKANSPLPNDNGDSEFNLLKGWTVSINQSFPVNDSGTLGPEPTRHTTSPPRRQRRGGAIAVARKSLRETVMCNVRQRYARLWRARGSIGSTPEACRCTAEWSSHQR